MSLLGVLAQSSALPPPPAPGSGHSVSALSIVLVVLVVLGSAAMVSLSSRRFKRRSTETTAAASRSATEKPPAPGEPTIGADAPVEPDLLSRLHRVTEAPPMERRRLGDRRPRNAAEVEVESVNPTEPGEFAAPPEPVGPAPAILSADDEQRLPEPIPIHRRSAKANATESANGSRTWPGSSPRAAMPGLSDDELRVLEPSGIAARSGNGGKTRRWPATRATVAHDADLALADELSAVVRELLFCANSGQLLHGFALYSDSFLFRTMDDSGLSEAEFKATFQQVAAKPIRDWTRLAELREIERHADNVVTATVVYSPLAGAADSPREKFRFLKNEETGAWMIDDIEPMD